MVSSWVLLNLLHCKRLKRKKSLKFSSKCVKEDEYQGPSGDNVSKTLSLKTEDEECEYDQTLCRVCLKEGSIPIFGSEDLSTDLNTIAGVEVSFDDTRPKNLCESCKALLQSAVIFRRTAQQSDNLLKYPRQHPPTPELSNENDNFIDNEEDVENITEGTAFDFGEDRDDEERKEVKIKVEGEQGRFHCKKCTLDFNTREEYREHRLSKEHDNLRKNCPICNKDYQAAYLKRHILIHKMDYQYICDVCGKAFPILGQFNRHRVTHFIEDLPFKCSLCPYRGRFRESLKMHMKVHTGDKPHQCPHCPTRFFTNKSNLNKHLFTHKTQHDFKCSQCQHGFFSKRDLDIHYKVVHIGIKDHVCNVCGKAFGYRKQMMKHQLKVHKRDKLRSGRMPLYLQLEKKMLEGKET